MRIQIALLLPALVLVPAMAQADASENITHENDGQWEGHGYHPWVHYPQVRTVDLSAQGRALNDYIAHEPEQPDFWSLDEHAQDLTAGDSVPQQRAADDFAGLPAGWVQMGNQVLPEDVAKGLQAPDLGPIFAVEDIPGNKYPRKHTLFLNFSGGMLYSGADNSAENRSNLAKQGVYPTFGGGESIALSVIQAVQADVEPYGVRIAYDYRPRNVVPYTMEMIGGSWTDTNIDSPAGGVAPGADCGALGQRHVVYTFSNGGSVTGAANTASQEAGHAWGLDHTFDCSSVMSYCGGGDKSFRSGCATLCEAQCQGPMSAGCRLTHEMFCGEGTDSQDDAQEMAWIFGGNEPDMEAPTVEIVEPEDGAAIESGGNINLRALVDDNYGGFGWKFVIKKDGEVIFDQPDYDRDVDPEFRAALNLVNLEDGLYELSVEAEDQYEHVTVDTVTVMVGEATAGTGGDTDSGSASDSDSDAGSASDSSSAGSDADSDSEGGSGGDTDSGGDSAGVDGGDKGCSVGGRSSLPGLAILLFALGWRRRRHPA